MKNNNALSTSRTISEFLRAKFEQEYEKRSINSFSPEYVLFLENRIEYMEKELRKLADIRTIVTDNYNQ